ncbi:MAG: hypothetical protein AUG49_03855 [Catenulispora sp. 13_1_20CM_3_70_7]|nr:MAG: hypothetical protein AUG49_03855 [Catenulispora sp. 13_1_20CM_3_70_7]
MAGAGVVGGDLAEDPVGEPGQHIAEHQRDEDRYPAEEAADADHDADRDQHGDQRYPLVLGPVDVRHDRRQVEADQQHHGAGDGRWQDGVDHLGSEEVDQDTDGQQDDSGDQDGAGDVLVVAALGADRGHTADEARRGAQVAGDLVLDDQQEADRGDAAHHDGQLWVQAHDQREDEGGAEHGDHVLRAEAHGAGPGQAFVGTDDRARWWCLAFVYDPPAQCHGRDCSHAVTPVTSTAG